MSTETRTHLFTYRYLGGEWSLEIKAGSAAEAKERLSAMGLARYDGELVSRIPSGFGLFAKMAVIVRNTAAQVRRHMKRNAT